jgi:hypothetical protein
MKDAKDAYTNLAKVTRAVFLNDKPKFTLKLIFISHRFSGLFALTDNDNHSKTMYISQLIP